jgi:hypothetical protein
MMLINMTVKKDVKKQPINELESSLKALANLTNDKRLYDKTVELLFQLWMGNDFGLRNINEFKDLVDYNWLRNRKKVAQKQGLRIVT